MAEPKRRTAMSEDVEGRDQTRGQPGTSPGRAGTAGTEGENVPRRDRARGRGRPRREDTDEGAGSTREHGEIEGTEEGIAGEGRDESGTLPGSVGGTTGTAGHSAGTQSPGATDPGFPGISPEEAKRRRREARRRERRGE